MRRIVRSSMFLSVLVVAACGGGGGTNPGDDQMGTPDADIGFNHPSAALKANTEVSDNNWMELGAANLGCLNTPSADVAATVDITLNTTVKDFQSGDEVPNASVVAFADIDIDNPFGAAATSDDVGAVAVAIPQGHKRIGFKMTQEDALDTFLLNQYLDPSTAVQTSPDKIQTVSNATGNTLPALIGETRIAGTGVAAGALRDCDGHEMSNFVVVMSSTSGTTTPITGAEAFYFSAGVGLPVHHNQQDAASQDGLFMVIQVPAATSAFVQAWGYPTDADVSSDNLTLISELKVPVLPDTVITGSFEPLRQ